MIQLKDIGNSKYTVLSVNGPMLIILGQIIPDGPDGEFIFYPKEGVEISTQEAVEIGMTMVHVISYDDNL